jgi:hypothetical protein
MSNYITVLNESKLGNDTRALIEVSMGTFKDKLHT